MNIIEAAIDRGVKLLNAYSPHWFKVIDLATFDITVCSDCIVGQVFGNPNFGANIATLGVTDTWSAFQFGFDTDDEYPQQELEEAWVDRITEYRDNPGAALTATTPEPRLIA